MPEDTGWTRIGDRFPPDDAEWIAASSSREPLRIYRRMAGSWWYLCHPGNAEMHWRVLPGYWFPLPGNKKTPLSP